MLKSPQDVPFRHPGNAYVYGFDGIVVIIIVKWIGCAGEALRLHRDEVAVERRVV